MFQVHIPCSTLVLDTATLGQTFHQLKNDFNPTFQLYFGTYSLMKIRVYLKFWIKKKCSVKSSTKRHHPKKQSTAGNGYQGVVEILD